MKRAFGYCRVSSDSQVDGTSLASQREQLQAICTAEGYELLAVFEDAGVSGSIPFSQRPEGARLLATAQTGDVIVAVKLDRAFRNLADALATVELLKTRSVGLFLKDSGGLVVGGAVGELLFSMLGSVAQFERARAQDRCNEGRRAAKARGLFAGGSVPFGSVPVVRGGKTYIDADEGVRGVLRDLMAKEYSSRLAAGHFSGIGVQVSHHAVARLMRELRAA